MDTPSPDPEFVRGREMELALRDGTPVLIRPVVPGDRARLVEGFERLSPESRYRRFMSAITRLRPAQLDYFTHIDYIDHCALGAIALDEPGEPGIGVARYVRIPDEPHVAEAAVVVADAFHGRGLGTLLLRALGAIALENGVAVFRAEILPENVAIRKVLARLGGRLERPGNPATYGIDLAAQMATLEGTALHPILAALARGEAEPRSG